MTSLKEDNTYNISGFPSEASIFKIDASVIAGSKFYNLARDRWEINDSFHYFPDQEQVRNKISMLKMLNREIEIYKKTVPTQKLFEHFRERTLETLEVRGDTLTEKEKKAKELLKRTVPRTNGYGRQSCITSFYDFALQMNVLPAFSKDSIGRDSDNNLEAKKIYEFQKVKAETAFAMHYYMSMLGSSGLPDLKFQGYDTLKKATGKEEFVFGEGAAYGYLMYQMSHHPRWIDICKYQMNSYRVDTSTGEHDTSISEHWALGMTPAYKDSSYVFPEESVYSRAFEQMQSFDMGMEAVRSYQEKYRKLSNADKPIPYFDFGNVSLNNDLYDGISEGGRGDEQANFSATNYFKNVNEMHRTSGQLLGCGVGAGVTKGAATALKVGRTALSGRYAMAGAAVGSIGGPVGMAVGMATSVAIGLVVDELMIRAIEPVFDYIKSTRFDDACLACKKINERISIHNSDMSLRLQRMKPFIDNLSEKRKKEIEEQINKFRKELNKELDKKVKESFFKLDEKSAKLIKESKSGRELEDEMKKMVKNYCEQEALEQEYAIYATAVAEKGINRTKSTLFNEIVKDNKEKAKKDLSGDDERRFMNSEIFPSTQRSRYLFGFGQNAIPLYHDRSYDENRPISYLLGKEDSASNRDERLQIYPLFGRVSFEKFKKNELAFLNKNLISQDELKKFNILTNSENVESFVTGFKKSCNISDLNELKIIPEERDILDKDFDELSANEKKRLSDLSNKLKIINNMLNDLSEVELTGLSEGQEYTLRNTLGNLNKKLSDEELNVLEIFSEDLNNLKIKDVEEFNDSFDKLEDLAEKLDEKLDGAIRFVDTLEIKSFTDYAISQGDRYSYSFLKDEAKQNRIKLSYCIAVYAKSKNSIGLPDEFKLFPDRIEVIRQAKRIGKTPREVAVQFFEEKNTCQQIIEGLSKAPDFKEICKYHGWIDKTGNPDLNKIGLSEIEKFKPQTHLDVMNDANKVQQRLETLLKAFENYRSLPECEKTADLSITLRQNAQSVTDITVRREEKGRV